MADYPSFLPPPQQSGYSIRKDYGIVSSDVAAGPPILLRRSFHTFEEIPLTFQMSLGQSTYFEAWIRTGIDGGAMPFNMEILVEGQLLVQECQFTAKGLPQVTRTNAETVTYQATVYVKPGQNRGWMGDFGLLEWFASKDPHGDAQAAARYFDQMLNG